MYQTTEGRIMVDCIHYSSIQKEKNELNGKSTSISFLFIQMIEYKSIWVLDFAYDTAVIS
jgi:hypothetical protein